MNKQDLDIKKKPQGKYVNLDGELFYKIENHDWMDPFFMSIVSSSNHWLFVSSTGGISAGRSNPDGALFPYYTDDRISENFRNTGPASIVWVLRHKNTRKWEPFFETPNRDDCVVRNIYKNLRGNKVVFEEINSDIGLSFKYSWSTSEKYGFVRTVSIQELSGEPCTVDILDGLQNLLPANTGAAMQMRYSNLLDAYKRAEFYTETGLGIFSYNSLPSDLAEPNESLSATVAWQRGLPATKILLSSRQLDDFRRGIPIRFEEESRGVRCAFFVESSFKLNPNEKKSWYIVADVGLNSAEVASLNSELAALSDTVTEKLESDIYEGSLLLDRIVGFSDGIQKSEDIKTTAHHYTNVLFNVMRGGIFSNGYWIDRSDVLAFFNVRNRKALNENAQFFASLPEKMLHAEFVDRALKSGNATLIRLCYEYMPLMFGRRHGDPSRPWNHFSINLKNEDGSLKLDYQGNWRDIFQNWEALAWSYPDYAESMVFAFLNATTADGYNPYRVMRNGIEWEVLEEDNPWSNIGYWSDHQVIYLVKLLELSKKFNPQQLESFLNMALFSHADVPYRISDYTELLKDPYHSIRFDKEAEERALARWQEIGNDGKLLWNKHGEVVHVTMMEKLLSLLLAKLGNFLPEGGIWMNTQRPEWNDANNALAGKGLSIVTTAYLYRFMNVVSDLLANSNLENFKLTKIVQEELFAMNNVLEKYQLFLESGFDDQTRRMVLDELGTIAARTRNEIYENGLSEEQINVPADFLAGFFNRIKKYLRQTLSVNKREDGLYHAYNVIHFSETTASISYLEEMLEGQVAILSSGFLDGAESLQLIRSVRASRLYRTDQHSYILYPDHQVTRFSKKNIVPANEVENLRLIAALERKNNPSILVKDDKGQWYFAPNHRNARLLRQTLEHLAEDPDLRPLVEAETEAILQIYESVFNHKYFTGRSGSFFGYEGLGSIYWHMVSKYLLAVQETYFAAKAHGEDSEVLSGLAAAYQEIRAGLGFNKEPAEYGAFPSDPYSHTPGHAGAKQPGMTGSVKEEILARLGELGISADAGRLSFAPSLLSKKEFLSEPALFTYFDVVGQQKNLEIPAHSLAFTYCQVPVVYRHAESDSLQVEFSNGKTAHVGGLTLDENLSAMVFQRNGQIAKLVVNLQSHAE